MNLFNYYYYFNKAINENICDAIIDHGNSLREEVGITSGLDNKELKEEDINNLKVKRNSNVSWFSDRWVYDTIQPFIHEANEKAGWNFQWDWSEPFQFTKYKLDQHYDWHCDSYEKPYDHKDNINTNGKVRKLSAVLFLSKKEEYKGGEFMFDFRNNDSGSNIRTLTEVGEKGDIIIFPSFVWHKVSPVTEGIRYSLVSWHLGYPFK